jgi:hypothetical protein
MYLWLFLPISLSELLDKRVMSQQIRICSTEKNTSAIAQSAKTADTAAIGRNPRLIAGFVLDNPLKIKGFDKLFAVKSHSVFVNSQPGLARNDRPLN